MFTGPVVSEYDSASVQSFRWSVMEVFAKVENIYKFPLLKSQSNKFPVEESVEAAELVSLFHGSVVRHGQYASYLRLFWAFGAFFTHSYNVIYSMSFT